MNIDQVSYLEKCFGQPPKSHPQKQGRRLKLPPDELTEEQMMRWKQSPLAVLFSDYL